MNIELLAQASQIFKYGGVRTFIGARPKVDKLSALKSLGQVKTTANKLCFSDPISDI